MVTGASLFHVDVVVPTLRANVETLRRIVSLPVPPSFESLRYYLVVDGSHSANIVSLSDNQRVTVLSTDNGQRSLPAGASCARNTGIAASSAEWVVLLDDDVYPHPDLLYQYAQQLELAFGSCRQQNVAHIFGFAGVTELVGSPTSLWAETVRLCGMTVNFRIAALMRNPPWSPTANLMIRIRHPAEQPELVEESLGCRARHSDGLVDDPEAGPLLAARLAWCHFDESLPKSGGGEDVDLCVRAQAQGLVLVAAPLARVTHPLWGVKGILMRALRWSYAGGAIMAKHPHHSSLHFPNFMERLLLCLGMQAVLLTGPAGALLTAALLYLAFVLLALVSLPSRIYSAPWQEDVESRYSLHSKPLAACCGASWPARVLSLVLVHCGLLFLVDMCFQLGSLLAAIVHVKRGFKCLFCRRFDYTCGTQEHLPFNLAVTGYMTHTVTCIGALAIPVLLGY